MIEITEVPEEPQRRYPQGSASTNTDHRHHQPSNPRHACRGSPGTEIIARPIAPNIATASKPSTQAPNSARTSPIPKTAPTPLRKKFPKQCLTLQLVADWALRSKKPPRFRFAPQSEICDATNHAAFSGPRGGCIREHQEVKFIYKCLRISMRLSFSDIQLLLSIVHIQINHSPIFYKSITS